MRFLLLILLFGLTTPAHARHIQTQQTAAFIKKSTAAAGPIALDAETVSSTTTGTTTCNFTHTASGTPTLALAWIMTSANADITSITWGGTSMTLIDEFTGSETITDVNLSLYELHNPGTGGKTVDADFDDSSAYTVCIAQTFTGTDTVDATAESDNNGSTSVCFGSIATTLDLNSTDSWMVTASWWAGGDTNPFSITNIDNERNDACTGATTTNDGCYVNGDSTGDSGSLTHTTTSSASDECAQVSVELVPSRDFFAASSCVGGYDFETSGNWLNDKCITGTAFNLTDSGGPSHTTTDCEPNGNGGCAEFPANQELLASDDAAWIPSAFTAFIRFDNDTLNTFRLFQHMDADASPDDGWEVLMFNSGGNLQVQCNVDGAAEFLDSTVTSGEWRSVACVWDGTDIEIYVNGCSAVASPTSATTLTDPTGNDVHIGTTETGSGDFDGRMDEVGFFSEAFNATENLKLHNKGLPGTNTDREVTCP